MGALIEALVNSELCIRRDASGWQAYAKGPLPVILLSLLVALMIRAI